MTTHRRTEAIAEARERPLPWDDLRDRRTQRATWQRYLRGEGAAVGSSARRFGLALSALGVAAALLLLFRARVFEHFQRPNQVMASTAQRSVPFDEGSQGSLSADAEVEVTAREPARFEVAQRKGRVSYDIRHDPARQFVVHVADVTVTVLGTQFSVELKDSVVGVRVDRGRVRIFDGDRTTELVTGEAIEVRAFHAQAAEAPAASTAPLLEPDPAEPAPAAGASAPSPHAKPPSIEELLTQADAARAAGRSAEAAELLRAVLARHPQASQASNTEFTLARVERSRGRHALSAQAFERCALLGGTLASEALAEEAASWLSAGDHARAKSAAERYVRYYAHGPHAQKMLSIIE